jgi:hypothetical protein
VLGICPLRGLGGAGAAVIEVLLGEKMWFWQPDLAVDPAPSLMMPPSPGVHGDWFHNLDAASPLYKVAQ